MGKFVLFLFPADKLSSSHYHGSLQIMCERFKGYRTKKDGRFLKDGTFASKHLCSEKIWRAVVCLIEAIGL